MDDTAAVRDVIRQGSLCVQFQPIFDITSSRCFAFEALARFPDGTPPDLWFSAAERAGLGVELEMNAATEALRNLPALPENVCLSINISPAALISGRLSEALRAYPHERVIVELSERGEVTDTEALVEQCRLLQFRGARIAIDDFGSGRSRVKEVLQLRPEFIKLDRSVIEGVFRDAPRRALIASLLSFGAETRTEIIAEGIETAVEFNTLLSLGVRLGQGWFMSRPVEIGTALAQTTLLRQAGLASAPTPLGSASPIIASPPPPAPPLIRCLREIREMLERARSGGNVREVEQAIERINTELARERAAGRPG